MSDRRRIGVVTEEFAEAAERHLDDVHAYLVYLIGDRAAAEELTAETFARACERWRRFDPRGGRARRRLRPPAGPGPPRARPPSPLDCPRPLSRRGPPPPARGSLRRPRA